VTFLAAVSATASSAAGSPASNTTPNDVQAGVLGFLVVAAIGVALVFLLRSMNKQFKKIGPKPEDPKESLPGGVVAGEVLAEGPGEASAQPEGTAAESPEGSATESKASRRQLPDWRPAAA
jgi:hypothetical protein